MELRDLCVAKRDEGYTLEEYERAVNGNWDITAYARNQKMFCLRDGMGFPEGYENCIESYHLQGRKVTIIGNELLSGMKVMWMMIGWDPRDLICWYWKDNDMIPFTLSGKNIRITEEQAFVNYAKTKENVFIDRISMVNYVLAHEFFHAYQDFCVCFEKMDRELGRFQGDDRIESFAEYFALRFLKDVLKDETLFQYMKESREASRKRSAELGKKDPYGDAVSLFGDIEKDTTECFLSEYDKWVSDIRGSYRK